MANVGTLSYVGDHMLVQGVAGVNDNDVVIQLDNCEKYDDFSIMSTGGAMDVLVSLDGTNFTTAPLSLVDLGATTSTPVIVTAAGRLYRFRGPFKHVQVLQNGVTAVANAALLATRRR